MSIQSLQSLITHIQSFHGRTIKADIALHYENELKKMLGEEQFVTIMTAKTGVKKSLLSTLQQSLDKEIIKDIVDPQREQQNWAITKWSIQKVDRLPLNAKLHLLKINSLLHNLQLAFSDPVDYIEFDSKYFVGMSKEKIEEQQRWAIREYLVIHPKKAESIYQKLWLTLSIQGTKQVKNILSEAKIHNYTASYKQIKYKEKQTPRIIYIDGFPMLFGKNLVHVPYSYNTTRSERSKYDIDTSAKIFDDFYSLIRAHSHIQDSEEAGMQTLTELNTDFAQALSIIKDKSQREELEIIITKIIQTLHTKKDSKLKKAEEQDLIYILQNHHTIRNNNKLSAAWTKIKHRITTQQSIKNMIALQQNALQRDLAQQEISAREYIKKLDKHIEDFDTKSWSARTLVNDYKDILYAKPFFDLHDHIIKLEDQKRVERWMPFSLQQKIKIDLLLQRRYINILKLEHLYKTTKKIHEPTMQTLEQISIADKKISDRYIQMLTTTRTITEQFSKNRNADTLEEFIQAAKTHKDICWKKILTEK
jgi:hypothetical protein